MIKECLLIALKIVPPVLVVIAILLLIRVLLISSMVNKNPVYIKYKKELDDIRHNIGKRVYYIKEANLSTFNSHTRNSDYLLNYMLKNDYEWFEKELPVLEELTKRCNIDMFDVRSELASQHQYIVAAVEDIISEIEEFKYLSISVSYNSPGGRKSYMTGYRYTVKQLREVMDRMKGKESKSSTYNKERGKLTPKLRYKILSKYDYTCQYCGATAEDGAKLHIDHIIPVSKGGLTEEDNLTVACQECNLGKSDIVYVKEYSYLPEEE